MSDVKISGLPSSTGVTPTSDYIPIVHNGTTEKITPDQLISGSGFVTTAQLSAGLAPKADTTTVNAQLATKVNSADLSDTTGAGLVGFSPTGTIASTTVQTAIAEINTDLAASSGSSLVGFQQTGTGAVARTVSAKLKDAVSVMDFIPAGTSTSSTNCTAYIQAAIDSVGVNGTIYLPKGIYRCRGLNLTANKYLVGAGEASTKLRFFRSGNTVTDSTSYVLNWTGSYGGLSDLTIDGQGGVDSYDNSIGNGLFISNDSGGYHRIMKNVTVKWFAGYSATATGTYGINANYSQAELQSVVGGNAFVISSASYASEIQIIGIIAGNCDNIGIDLGRCNDSRLENIYVVNACKHGIFAEAVANWHFVNIKVYLCRMLNPRTYLVNDEQVLPYTLAVEDTSAAVVLSGRGHTAVNFEAQENGSNGFVFGVDQYELSASVLSLLADGNGGYDPSATLATNITYRRYGILAYKFSYLNLTLNGCDLAARIGRPRQSKAIYVDSVRASYSSISTIYAGAFYRIKSNTGSDFTPLQYALTTKSNAVGFVFCCTSSTGVPDPATVFGTGSLEVVNGNSNFILDITNQTDQLDGIGLGYSLDYSTGTTTIIAGGVVKSKSENTSTEIISARQDGDLYPRIALFSSGALRMGSGASGVDVVLSRISSTSMGTATTNSFRAGNGVWNEGHLLMGAYHLWIDSTGRLRIKSSAPTSDTDGTVVGTQT